MSWDLKLTHAVEIYINELPHNKKKGLAKEMALLRLCGNQLRLPHSKSLGKGLFEVREREFGLRLYYTFCAEKLIIVLTGGDKGSQTRDIKKARALLGDIK